METLLFALTSLAKRWLQPRHNAQVQFLREQIRILRARIPSERIIVSPVERAELMRLPATLSRQSNFICLARVMRTTVRVLSSSMRTPQPPRGSSG